MSKSAAARVLSGRGSASERTREAVLRAARDLGYRPNGLARSMKSGSTQTIGVVLPDVASAFFSAVLRGVSEAARRAGFEVIVSNTGNDAEIEERSIDVLAEKRVDGIVVAPVLQETSRPLQRMHDDGVPVVLVDRRPRNLAEVPLCSLDHASATQSAVDLLIAHGHERIAIVSESAHEFSGLSRLVDRSPQEISLLRPSAQRLLGYVRSFQRHGLTLDDALVRPATYNVDSADRAVTELLADPRGATALHCTDEVLTYGAYRAFVRAETLPPDGMSFVGFDDQPWTTLMRPQVTVVEQATHELGAVATDTLLGLMRQEGAASDRFLSARMLSRGTVRAL